MRLKKEYAEMVKKIALKYFGENTKVYLFGSRTDPAKKGGDIDIYIETDLTDALFEKKIKMLVELKKNIGEQKIDIVINNFTRNLPIYEIAVREGIML